jgi:hypothetical protein
LLVFAIWKLVEGRVTGAELCNVLMQKAPIVLQVGVVY